jgi:1-aminocyclopropane-1-carboxylate deaminase/D-cysteine desulfhydrase-like pyridoxal-dependent ACC family enzyme
VTSLFELLPMLRDRVPWLPLGVLPTSVEPASAVLRACDLPGELWLKRDDLSSPVYGGNKLRLLEHLLAAAKGQGASEVYSTGAIGSNFALATALHAPRAGLEPGAICFPQQLSADGERNHALLTARARVVALSHWSLLPLEAELVQQRARRAGKRAVVLSQVRFDAEALFGYVNAGLELALQVAQDLCPAPARIVLPVGSGATTAGLLAGLSLARKLGVWRAAPPTIEAVRIAAWPLSRRGRVLGLAERALAGVARLSGDASLALERQQLVPLSLVTDQLGAGYPHATSAGNAARRAFADAGYAILDDTYAAKAAAHLLRREAATSAGPVLFWCTKSSTP